ncbi:hypothetical protein N8783_03995 [Alphaproteobacteria bacterium]|nr:hypothetical protein [Alphaproteobacteria bacterium]
MLFQNQQQLQDHFQDSTLAMTKNSTVEIDNGVVLGKMIEFSGVCKIGYGTKIEGQTTLQAVELGAENLIKANSQISNTRAGNNNIFGPFCYIRNNCILEDSNVIGAYVEAARSTFGCNIKVSHRAYLGDVTIEDKVIIGAGVIFCNWDGKQRQQSTVRRGALVGSGSVLISPITIGERSIVGAGSSISKDVPPNHKVIQKRESTFFANTPDEK